MVLADQDRTLWDRDLIAEGQAIVRACLRRNQRGPYQVQAAINAVHSDAPTAADTDWRQILQLYDQLLTLAPSPVAALNRAVALAEVEGPAAPGPRPTGSRTSCSRVITCTTRSGPICCAASVAPQTRRWPTALFVDPAEIPADADRTRLGHALASGRHGDRDELMANTAASVNLIYQGRCPSIRTRKLGVGLESWAGFAANQAKTGSDV